MWDLQTLECEHTLKQPRGHVRALMAVDEEVWGGVWIQAVVWGRKSAGADARAPI